MNEHNPQDDAVDEFKHARRRRIGQRINVLALTPEHARTLDTDEVAEKMIAAIPTGHPFDQVAGPFYDTAGLHN